ncbi:hypothetical protein EMN47_11520 [Prolixibacteraceae bacterium JC049]|nr:hypothetical protein [Prolixibacteraceae bacterium JC049]
MSNQRLILLIMAAVFINCRGRNQLQGNQEKLAQQITVEDSLLAASAKAMPQKISKGIQLKENRSIDKSYPIQLVDIAGQKGDSIDVKLSDIADVTFIPLESIPDSSNIGKVTQFVKLTDKYILVYGLSGIYQFGRDGRFIKTIVKNKIDNINVRVFPGRGSQMSWSSKEVIYDGAIGDIWVKDGFLYYTSYNSETKQYGFKKYQLNDDRPLGMNGNVEAARDTLPGKLLQLFSANAADGFQYRLNRNATTIPLSGDMFLNVPSAWSNASRGKNVMVGHSDNDSLCGFTNLNPVENYTKRIIKRGSTRVRRHWYKNMLTIYSTFSDTVFRVMPPNRFVPAYVFNFDSLKVTPNRYFTPGKLHGNLWVSDMLVETDEKLLVEYGDVDAKIAFGIYDKNKKHFQSVNYGKKNRGVVDDILGYGGYWPREINGQREEAKMVSGIGLKYWVKSDRFKQAEAQRKEEFERCIHQMKDDNHLLIIYKLK